uniref:Uncharacterized protein n=1 Tax=Ditylenchus dipsaci TaxID=166011 RepID=A0A915EBR9_9BILA
MQSKSSSLSSLSSLCECLRSERLLINNEQTILQNLSSKSQSERKEIYKLTWICRHEKAALSKLINSDPSVSPDNCCQLMAKSILPSLLRYLHEAPKAVAEFLVAAESLTQMCRLIS